MLENLGNLIPIIGFVFGSLSLIGGGYATFRQSVLRQIIVDQATRIETLEGLNKDKAEKISEADQKLNILEKETLLLQDRLKLLEEIVSGKIDFTALESLVRSHHEEINRKLDFIHEALNKKLDAIHEETIDTLCDIKKLHGAERDPEVRRSNRGR